MPTRPFPLRHPVRLAPLPSSSRAGLIIMAAPAPGYGGDPPLSDNHAATLKPPQGSVVWGEPPPKTWSDGHQHGAVSIHVCANRLYSSSSVFHLSSLLASRFCSVILLQRRCRYYPLMVLSRAAGAGLRCALSSIYPRTTGTCCPALSADHILYARVVVLVGPCSPLLPLTPSQSSHAGRHAPRCYITSQIFR